MEELKKVISGISPCPFCGKDNTFTATDKEMAGFHKWNSGEGNIQNVMPSLSAEKREVLISGICIRCQKSVFGINDDLPTPEPVEYELSKIGYKLGREENGTVEFINTEEGDALLLDYNLMRATKVLYPHTFNSENGNFEEMESSEKQILRKYEFFLEGDEINEPWSEDDLPF